MINEGVGSNWITVVLLTVVAILVFLVMNNWVLNKPREVEVPVPVPVEVPVIIEEEPQGNSPSSSN